MPDLCHVEDVINRHDSRSGSKARISICPLRPRVSRTLTTEGCHPERAFHLAHINRTDGLYDIRFPKHGWCRFGGHWRKHCARQTESPMRRRKTTAVGSFCLRRLRFSFSFGSFATPSLRGLGVSVFPCSFTIAMNEQYKQYLTYLKSDHWFALRRDALLTYGRRCDNCHNTKRLHVHHRSYRQLFDCSVADLQILCEVCHNDFHLACKKLNLINDGMDNAEVRRTIQQFRQTEAWRKREAKLERKRLGIKPQIPRAQIRNSASVEIRKAFRMCRSEKFSKHSLENMILKCQNLLAM